MFLSRKLGIAFFRNPRTGSRAVRQLLIPHCDIREVKQSRVTDETPFYKHIPPREARPHVERLGIDWHATRKFTVVRNPFTRLVSYYHWRMAQTPQPPEFKRHLLGAVRPDNIMCGSISFYAGDGAGKLMVDEVIRYEGLVDNLADLFSRWNVPLDARKIRVVGASPTYDLSEYYDQESIDFVLKNYDFEFSQMGYSRELPRQSDVSKASPRASAHRPLSAGDRSTPDRTTANARSAEAPVYVLSGSVVGPDLAWLWYCIPKNASRSLLRMLTEAGGVKLSLTDEQTRRRVASGRARYSFAFVRHPEARIVSSWRNKVLSPPRTPAQERLLANSPGLSAGMPLNDFVEWLAEAFGRGAVDKHWRPQRDYVCDRTGKVVPDFIGRVENLEADLRKVRARIGKLGKIPHLNPTEASPDERLSPRSRDILRDLYRSDYELFGYEPGA